MIPIRTLKKLWERSQGICEVIFDNGQRCTNKVFKPHHIKYKSRGGKDTLSNLIHTCFNCHYKIHFCSKEEFPFIQKYQRSKYTNSDDKIK